MKWFNVGKVLFSKVQYFNCMRAILFFPITFLMFIGIICCFLLFGLSYAFTFCLEVVGAKNDSNINEKDDKYVKVSKIVFTIILAPIISFGHLFLVLLYFPMAIFTLWTDALSFVVCKGESASFNISKYLLTFNK